MNSSFDKKIHVPGGLLAAEFVLYFGVRQQWRRVYILKIYRKFRFELRFVLTVINDY